MTATSHREVDFRRELCNEAYHATVLTTNNVLTDRSRQHKLHELCFLRLRQVFSEPYLYHRMTPSTYYQRSTSEIEERPEIE